MPAQKKDHPRYDIASFRCTQEEKMAYALAALKANVPLGVFLRVAADNALANSAIKP